MGFPQSCFLPSTISCSTGIFFRFVLRIGRWIHAVLIFQVLPKPEKRSGWSGGWYGSYVGNILGRMFSDGLLRIADAYRLSEFIRFILFEFGQTVDLYCNGLNNNRQLLLFWKKS